jgi:hypothetical protein
MSTIHRVAGHLTTLVKTHLKTQNGNVLGMMMETRVPPPVRVGDAEGGRTEITCLVRPLTKHLVTDEVIIHRFLWN